MAQVAAMAAKDPEKFANAAKTAAEALGTAVESSDKALDLILKAKGAIAAATPGQAIVVNMSSKSGTWYTYNAGAPIKWTTQFQSYMGKDCAVPVHTIGWGSMQTFLDNSNPPYAVNRDMVHAFTDNGMQILNFGV